MCIKGSILQKDFLQALCKGAFKEVSPFLLILYTLKSITKGDTSSEGAVNFVEHCLQYHLKRYFTITE
jgi:hypothetical protein